MPRSLAEVRLDDFATCRHVLFIEGEPDAYTDDESGGLIGHGLGSWIGLSETEVGGVEVLGTRRVRGGLILPESVTFAIEPKTGELQPSPVSFQILDVDDTLSYLFASEGKDYDELAERIAPGTSALSTSVATPGGTTNPRGRYIGPERIGPSGQRRFCPALPFELIGFDHAVAEHLPPILISDEPIEFAGRMATLYRVYKLRPDLDDSDPTAWATWDECEAAGDRVWWGVLQDAGNVGGNDVWSIDCHGPDALTRKTLGTRSTSQWMPLVAEPATTDAEKLVAIGFMSSGNGLGNVQYFNSSVFQHSFTTSTRADIADELNGWIEDALSGLSAPDLQPAGAFDTWVDVTGSPNPLAGVDSQGVFFVQRDDGSNDELEFGAMFIAMHRDYWRLLGWDPELQHAEGTVFGGAEHGGSQAPFTKLVSGEALHDSGWSTGAAVPGDGFYLTRFTTCRAGENENSLSSEPFDNGGQPRLWNPMHTSAVFSLRPEGNQVIRVSELQGKFLEGQPEAGIESATNEIDGNPVELGGWFVVRGDLVTVEDDEATEGIEFSDSKKVYLVCKGEWIEGANYGDVSEGSGVSPAIRIAYYEYPRAWGFDNNRWIYLAGKVAGRGTIEITPLRAYHYKRYTKPFEVAPSVWLQVMLSTGTATGFDDAHDVGGIFTGGPNAPVTPGLTYVDSELADMGLGIPYQIVQLATDVYDQFETVPGGAEGPLNRVRIGYIGPYQARDVLDSLMRPRRLSWSLAGKKFGLFKLGPVSPEDVDLNILEDDLYGEPGNPASCIPSQMMRATGQLDRVDLSYRFDAVTGKTSQEAKYQALDAGARARTGELVEEITDHGLPATPLFGSPEKQAEVTGVEDWSEPFRDLWAREAAKFFALRHYSLEMTLARPLGQDAMPGCSVAITNPWPVNPRGGRGITNATGRIYSATHSFRDFSTRVGCIVFVGADVVHYSPAVQLLRVDGTTVEWHDYTDVDADGRGFVEPDWSDTGGEMQVDFYQRTGNTWAVVFSAGVVSVDLATRTAVLDAAPGTALLRDKDTWMVARSYADQNANEWPRALYGVTTDTDQTIGDGSTKAPAFLS